MKVSDIQVTSMGHFGDDLAVVNAARVSFEKESKGIANEDGWFDGTLSDGDTKLINYLAKHKHFSPFNHAFLSFRIKAPIFVARQLVKHKFLPWNEVSRRYVTSEPEFYFPPVLRRAAANVKQGSADEAMDQVDLWDSAYKEHTKNAAAAYRGAIECGMCPEQARSILPHNLMTEWIWSGTLGAFLDMLVLRLDPHTQYESRVVAEQIAKHVKEHFPVSFDARINSQ